MRRAALLLVMTLASSALARGHGGVGYHAVRGYTKKSGTYVAPHYAKNPSPKPR